jgi:glutamine synthetase
MPLTMTDGTVADIAAAASSPAQCVARLKANGIETVRMAFVDQHGLVRGKTVMIDVAEVAFAQGIGFVGTNLLKDTSDRTAFPVFTAGAGMADMVGDAALARRFQGAGDVLLMPDLSTLRTLPWAERTAWVLCEAVFADRPTDEGAASNAPPANPFCSRTALKHQLARLSDLGYTLQVGLEIEFHLFRLESTTLPLEHAGWPCEPPAVSLVNGGYRLLAEQRIDALEPFLTVLRRQVQALGLPLTSHEIELGPSQIEFVFAPQDALAAADAMALFRNATKQIARRHGLHASFMCRPRIPQVMSSGWHLHQSLLREGNSVMAQADAPHALSDIAQHALGGLLAHAAAVAPLAAPTVNAYRRYRPNSLAPDRATWARDNRGAMVRVVGEGASLRFENRIGDPAANPYFYLAGQVAAMVDGLKNAIPCGSSADTPYASDAPALPTSLHAATEAFHASAMVRTAFGDAFVNWLSQIKRTEWRRFEESQAGHKDTGETTEWEHREYFEMF